MTLELPYLCVASIMTVSEEITRRKWRTYMIYPHEALLDLGLVFNVMKRNIPYIVDVSH